MGGLLKQQGVSERPGLPTGHAGGTETRGGTVTVHGSPGRQYGGEGKKRIC